jgi:hypothetical protein
MIAKSIQFCSKRHCSPSPLSPFTSGNSWSKAPLFHSKMIPYSTLHVKSAAGFDPLQLEMSNQYYHPLTEWIKAISARHQYSTINIWSDSIGIRAHFVIHVQISISMADNKNAFALWHPCNTSAPAAIFGIR